MILAAIANGRGDYRIRLVMISQSHLLELGEAITLGLNHANRIKA
jgi:hypothetical protein